MEAYYPDLTRRKDFVQENVVLIHLERHRMVRPLAPAVYYRASGIKGNAVAPANRLFAEMRRHYEIDMRLAV